MRLALLAVLLLPAAVLAAEEPPQDELGTLLGLGVRSRPDYDGASKQELEPIPVIRYYGKTLFARTTQGILEGGARVNFTPGLAAGVQVAYEEGNDRTDFDPGASVGVHLEWDTKLGPAPINVLARLRRQMHTVNRTLFDLRGAVGVYGSSNLKIVAVRPGDLGERRVGARLLHHWRRRAGLHRVRHRRRVRPQPALGGLASLSSRRLQGDAASSPITEDKTNYYASAGVAYRF